MTDRQRKAAKEEIFHDLVKDVQKNIGEVDASEVAALGTILEQKAAEKQIGGLTAGEVIRMQQAVLSDTGADPTRALQQMKEKLDRDRRQRGAGVNPYRLRRGR